MWDHATGRSKGYGFVSFRTKEDAEAAIEQMQGVQIGSRHVRVGWAQHKQEEICRTQDADTIDRSDPSNTNVYLGNIAPETTELDLNNHFIVYGPIVEVKLHKKGGYGFVKYLMHDSAVNAIIGSRGRELHGRVLKLAWGKNLNAAANNKNGTSNNRMNLGSATLVLNNVAAALQARGTLRLDAIVESIIHAPGCISPDVGGPSSRVLS